MADNVVTSDSVNPKQTKKAAPKKAAAKKTAAPKVAAPTADSGKVVIVFESGASYSSGGVRFTRENNIQEVEPALAEFLLTLDNFRLPNQIELEEFLASKED